MPKPKVNTKKSKVKSVKAWAELQEGMIGVYRIWDNEEQARYFAGFNSQNVIPVLISPLSKSSKAK